MPFTEIELYDNKQSFLLVPVHKSKVTTDGNVLEGPQHDEQNMVLIERRTARMTKVQASNGLFDNMKSMTRILGVLGCIQLLSGPFLVVILKREYVGSIKKHKIYRLAQIQFIPFQPTAFRKLTEREREREYNYIEMINRVFVADQAHYFSYTCDLTQTFQRQADLLDGSFFTRQAKNSSSSSPPQNNPKTPPTEHSLWTYAQERFFWNHHLTAPLRAANLHGFVIPVIRGYLEIIVHTLNKKKIKFGILSRIGSKRSGTRYNTRGADLNGNVANFVETEQFVLHDGLFACFLQVRGSIPLIWTQYANLKYTPEIKFHKDKSKQKASFRAHMLSLFESYGGSLSVVNLCKKKGQELILSKYYETLLDNVSLPHKIDYHAFDFHSETKGLRMDRISLLLDEMKDKIEQYAFYLEQYKPSKNPLVKEEQHVDTHTIPRTPPHQEADLLLDFSTHEEQEKTKEKDFEKSGDEDDTQNTSQDKTPKAESDSPASPSSMMKYHKTIKEQDGVFRVNCVDCCDRTNVVETAFARVLLEQQLKMMGVFSEHESIMHHEKFNKIFQHFWANNGDRVSSLYAGTGALMGDFTRTGQRSVVGFMRDGVNAVSRYVQNNFKDADKQRSLHLVLGLLDIEEDNGPQENVFSGVF